MGTLMNAESSLTPAKLRKDGIRLGILFIGAALAVAFAPSGLKVLAGVLSLLGALLCLGAALVAVGVLRSARASARRGITFYGLGFVAFAVVTVLAFLNL